MAVHLRVGNRIWEVGTGDLLHAFFSTVSYHLEPNGWGARFPVLMKSLYQGRLEAAEAEAALNELGTIQAELKAYPPSQVIWDIENLAARPPWGDNISQDITDLSNYFVTSDGRDLIEVMRMALERLQKAGGTLTIE